MTNPSPLVRKRSLPEEMPMRSGGWLTAPDIPFFLSRLRDEFDQLFERFSRVWEGAPAGTWRWDIDVREEEDQVVVRAEAPGFEPSDFDLQVRGNQLLLRARRQTTQEDAQKGVVRQEQEFYQTFTLPQGIDPEKVSAKYVNGVLYVTLPKTQQTKARKIPIHTG